MYSTSPYRKVSSSHENSGTRMLLWNLGRVHIQPRFINNHNQIINQKYQIIYDRDYFLLPQYAARVDGV